MSLYEEWSKIGTAQRNLLADVIVSIANRPLTSDNDEDYKKEFNLREDMLRQTFDRCESLFNDPSNNLKPHPTHLD